MVNDIRPHGKRPAKKAPRKAAPKRRVQSEEPAFVPPEFVRDSEETTQKSEKPQPLLAAKTGFSRNKPSSKQPVSPHRLLVPILWLKDRWTSLSKRGKIITAAAIMGLAGGSVSAAVVFWPQPVEPPKPEPVVEMIVEPPKPTTEASKLTGVQVPFDINKLPVTGVMIENSPDARPQSGLLEAGVVFEAQAEGGITRFLALYQDTKPAYVGPVRSSRPYYIRWLLGFDATYSHAGGSPQALNDIRALGVKDIDHGANGSTYDRVSSRYAPHNLYTSIDRLLAAATARGYGTSNYTGFTRKDEKKIETPTASAISIAISSPMYNVHYTYDTANNGYLRNMAGQAHTDEKSGTQISPKVVIALVTDHAQDGIYSVYRTTGSGQAYIFQDGDVIIGTWSKLDERAPLQFKDAAGNEQGLNPGQTWITVVGNSSAVTYTP